MTVDEERKKLQDEYASLMSKLKIVEAKLQDLYERKEL